MNFSIFDFIDWDSFFKTYYKVRYFFNFQWDYKNIKFFEACAFSDLLFHEPIGGPTYRILQLRKFLTKGFGELENPAFSMSMLSNTLLFTTLNVVFEPTSISWPFVGAQLG